ncbi:MAG: hypothetical protein ACRC6I_12555 [Paracoccaceae bacterium]
MLHLAQAFASAELAARSVRMRIAVLADRVGHADQIGNPLKMSHNPVTYAKSLPTLGADARAVLARQRGLRHVAFQQLPDAGVIEGNLNP